MRTLHNPGYNKLASLHNQKCQNHDGGETVCAFRLGPAFKRCILRRFVQLNPLQVKRFEYFLKGNDIVAVTVLLTGYGKFLNQAEQTVYRFAGK